MIMTMIMTMTISSIVIEVIGVFYFFYEEILQVIIETKAIKAHKQTKRDGNCYSHKKIHEQTYA